MLGRDEVYIVDSCARQDSEPGRIREFAPEQFEDSLDPSFPHGTDFVTALRVLHPEVKARSISIRSPDGPRARDHKITESMFDWAGMLKPGESVYEPYTILVLHQARAFGRPQEEPHITSTDVRARVTLGATRGIGSVKASRGTLIHDYETDEKGIVKDLNLLVATVQKNAAMDIAVKKTGRDLIKGGKYVTSEPICKTWRTCSFQLSCR